MISHFKFVATVLISLQLTNQSHADTVDKNASAPLTEYSTEEIVTEYHRRLQAIYDDTSAPFEESLNKAASDLKVSGEEKEELSVMLELLIDELTPFVDAGEREPVLILGLILVDDIISIIEPDECRGLSLLNEAAKYDDGRAAIAISQYFRFKSVFGRDTEAERTSLFWAKEAAHRNPGLNPMLDFLTQDMTEGEVTELVKAWGNWSPGADPGIQNKIEELCRQ